MTEFAQNGEQQPIQAVSSQLVTDIVASANKSSTDTIDPTLDMYPALRGYREALGKIYQNEDEARIETQNAEITRRQRRFGANYYLDVIETAILANARVVAEVSNADERARLSYMLLYSNKISSNRFDASPFFGEIAERTVDIAEVIMAATAASDELTSQVDEKLKSGGSDAEYRLLMQVADYTDDDEWEPEALFTPTHALTIALATTGSQIAEVLKENITSGVFNRNIARDVLKFILESEKTLPNGMGKIAELLHFTGLFTRQQEDDALIERMVFTVEHWPREQRHALQSVIDEISQSFTDRIQMANRFVRGVLFGLTPNPMVEADNAITEMLLQVSRHRMTGQLTTYSKAEIMIARAEAKRRTRASAAQTRDSTIESPSLMEKPELTIMSLNIFDGSIEERDSTSFKKIQEDFLGRTPSAALVADYDKVFNYMHTNVDFSNGVANGVKKINGPAKINGVDVSVFEFKPSIAPGLSMVSERGKNMRVLFALLADHKLGVITVCDRKQLNNTLRSLGFGTAGQK